MEGRDKRREVRGGRRKGIEVRVGKEREKRERKRELKRKQRKGKKR